MFYRIFNVYSQSFFQGTPQLINGTGACHPCWNCWFFFALFSQKNIEKNPNVPRAYTRIFFFFFQFPTLNNVTCGGNTAVICFKWQFSLFVYFLHKCSFSTHHWVEWKLLWGGSSRSRCQPSWSPRCPQGYNAPGQSTPCPASSLPACRKSGSPHHLPPVGRERERGW